MNKPLVDHVKDFLEKHLNELTFGENLFINFYPDNPNTIVSIIDGGGKPPDRYIPKIEKVIEIKLRAKDYHDGVYLGNRILSLFHSRENYMMGTQKVFHSYTMTDLSYLYTDDQNRPEFSFELVFLIQNNNFYKGD